MLTRAILVRDLVHNDPAEGQALAQTQWADASTCGDFEPTGACEGFELSDRTRRSRRYMQPYPSLLNLTQSQPKNQLNGSLYHRGTHLSLGESTSLTLESFVERLLHVRGVPSRIASVAQEPDQE